GKELVKALNMSFKTLSESPNNSAFLDTYGWIKYKLGDIAEAKEYIQKAIEIGNVSAEVYEHLGDIYIETNELVKAKEMYKKALELESDRFDLEEKIKIKTGK
ncbi:MAG: tetratricopeptide repeat protein, partial [Candidatus Kapaibacterium sp.]